MLSDVRLLFCLLFLIPALCAAEVRIEKTDSGFRLMRDGQSYFIRGAVGTMQLELLPISGGNSTRTAPQQLDRAHSLGLTALVNLPLGIQRRGFDYGDPAALQKQRQRIREIVERYRSHPAVLMWAIGNEPEIHTTPEQRRALWKEVNSLAEMIKRLDPAHPVITVIGGQYKQMLHELKDQCPALDAVGLNSYQDMLSMPEDVAAQGWEKAYIVTEFGPRGHWQVPKTPWKIPIEDTSTEKAEFYEKAYRHAVLNRPNCLGSYVFYWSQKQEKTHTWYGLFLEDGSRTGAIDVMSRLWTGKEPANRCPVISKIRATPGGESPSTHAPGARFSAEVTVTDPDHDPLDVRWDLRPDVADNPNVGGDYEPSVEPIPGSILQPQGARVTVQLPEKPGNYRLFVYARDGRGNAATANLALRIQP
jgi:hemoglobin-like flavoprotein